MTLTVGGDLIAQGLRTRLAGGHLAFKLANRLANGAAVAFEAVALRQDALMHACVLVHRELTCLDVVGDGEELLVGIGEVAAGLIK